LLVHCFCGCFGPHLMLAISRQVLIKKAPSLQTQSSL
jgi:hypothetical protein